MALLTKNAVLSLLDQFHGEGMVSSCYADLTVADGFQSNWPAEFKTKRHAVKKLLADEPRLHADCEADLKTIRRQLEGRKSGEALGMAVFSSQQRDFLRSFSLPVPVENEIVIHREPYLVPLIEAYYKQREYLVIHTDTHRGRLYAATMQDVSLLKEIDEEVPKRRRASGQRRGWAPAAIARNREDHILHFRKDLVAAVESVWKTHSFRGIILAGEHEIVQQFRRLLPERLEKQVCQERALAWAEKPHSVKDEILSCVKELVEAEEAKLLQNLEDRVAHSYAVASGPQEVLQAIQDGLVGSRGFGYLVIGPDARETVGRCTACRFLSTDVQPSCPRCGQPCEEGNLWEEILLFALRHELDVHVVRNSEELAKIGGVAAVLPDEVIRKRKQLVSQQ